MRPTERSAIQSVDARGLLRQAQELAQQGDYPSALATIQRAMRSGADKYTCYLHIAALEWQRQHADAAMLALRHAIELQPHRTDAHEKMVEIYLASGEADAAVEQANHVLRRDPDNVRVRRLLVQAHLDRGDLDSALRVLDELVALGPNEPIYHFHKAQLFQEMEQWGLALISYLRVVEIGTDAELAERAQEAIAILDTIQLEQVLTLIVEDPLFRREFYADAESALVQRQFALSRAGLVTLRAILQLAPDDLPWKPVLYH